MLNITSPDWQRSSETNSPQLSEHVNPHRCIWGSHHVAEFGWQQRNESHREWHYDNDWKRQMWTFVYNFPFFSHLSCRLAVVGQATSRLHRLHVFKGILEDDTGVFFFFFTSSLTPVKKPGMYLPLRHCYTATGSLLPPPQKIHDEVLRDTVLPWLMPSIMFNNTCSAVLSRCVFIMQLITSLMGLL